MKLQADLREFIELLNSANVKYVIVGGYAVAFHGHPRLTADIDKCRRFCLHAKGQLVRFHAR